MPSSSASISGRVRSLSLRTRLIAAFLVVSLASLVVAGFALNRMSAISDQAQTVYERGTVQLDATRNLQVLWWEYAAHDVRTAIEAMPPDALAAEEKASKETAGLVDRIADVQAMDLPPSVATRVADFATAVAANQAVLAKLAGGEVRTAEDQDAALAELDGYAADAEKAITAANSAEQADAADQAKSARDACASARTLTLVIIGAPAWC